MPNSVFSLFDTYSLRARLMPALVALLPLPLALAAWFPDKLTSLSGVVTFIALFGGAHFLAQIARDKGKAMEKALFSLWGGTPSMLILRHRNAHLNAHTKNRYHETLQHLLPSLDFPTVEDEKRNAHKADQAYTSCSDHLREQTRSSEEFPLIFAENINYGTRRNLLGLKPLAIVVATVAIIACAVAITRSADTSIGACSLVVCSAFFLWWCCRVRPSWVKVAAFAYAERLLAACEKLTNNKNQ